MVTGNTMKFRRRAIVRFGSRGLAGVAVASLVAACAAGPTSAHRVEDPGSPAAGVPTSLQLNCRSDGSIELSSERVQARPDGVHLTVVNGSGEPVSVGGFDADPGTSTWTLTDGPGMMGLNCWPFSQHSSGQEPDEQQVEIVDPTGMFFDGQITCAKAMSGHGDFGEAPQDEGPPPLDVARDIIVGLRPDDVVRLAGYPEQDNASVIVIRDGEVIASYGFVRFAGRSWSIAGGTVCSGAGLSLFGERV